MTVVRNFIIEAKSEMPYAIPVKAGYELISNDRRMKFVAVRRSLNSHSNNLPKTYFAILCYILEDIGWVKSNNSSNEPSISEFVKKISISPRFTKAVAEYRQQLEIKEPWK